MNRYISLVVVLSGILILSLCLVTTTAVPTYSANSSEVRQSPAAEPSGDELPEARRQEWESLKKHLRHDYDVCAEHCGNSDPCLNKCEDVYRYRIEVEYKRILHSEEKKQ